MSRPIYEPSLPRADAELGYGNRQLFRRPSPSGESMEVPFAYMAWLNGAAVPSGDFWDPSEIPEDWTEGYINPAAAVVEQGVDTLLNPDLSAGGVEFSQAKGGLWHIHAHASWSDAAPASGFLGIRISIIGSGSPASPTSEDFIDANILMSEGAAQAHTHDAVALMTGNTGFFGMTIFQNSGGDLDIGYLYLVVHRIEIFDPATVTEFP